MPLVEEHKKFHILRLKDKLKINLIKVLISEIKYKIVEKVETENKFYIRDKNLMKKN